jgi:hypothetical protein
VTILVNWRKANKTFIWLQRIRRIVAKLGRLMRGGLGGWIRMWIFLDKGEPPMRGRPGFRSGPSFRSWLSRRLRRRGRPGFRSGLSFRSWLSRRLRRRGRWSFLSFLSWRSSLVISTRRVLNNLEFPRRLGPIGRRDGEIRHHTRNSRTRRRSTRFRDRVYFGARTAAEQTTRKTAKFEQPTSRVIGEYIHSAVGV